MAFEYQGFASLGVNLNRQKYGPLDISNVFTSEADLKYYLSKGAYTEGVSEYWTKVVPYPYEGQVLATVINGVVNVYALALDAEGAFITQEIAGKVEVDGETIRLNDEGKIELAGMEELETGKTYVPSLVNGKLIWAEPDTTTAEGQAQEIEGLKTRTAAIEATVNGTEEADGLVKKVADNTKAIADEVAAREQAASSLTAAIASALAEAKQYADDNDADTIYNDEQVKADIKTNADAIDAIETALENIYTKSEVYNKGEIDSALAAITHFTTEVVESTDEMVSDKVLYLIHDTTAEGADKYNEYLVINGTPTMIGDTTTDLSGYATKDELTAHETAADGKYATKQALTDHESTAAATYATKTELTEHMEAAEGKYAVKTEVETALGNKADASALASYYTKDEIDGKGYAVAETVASDLAAALTNYYTKAEAMGKTEAYTKAEVDRLLDEVSGGSSETAASVKRALDGYIKSMDTEIYGAEVVASWTDAEGNYNPQYSVDDSRVDKVIAAAATAQTQADKGVEEAAKANSAVSALENGQVATNKTDIETILGRLTPLETANGTHNTKIATLEGKVSGLEAEDTAINAAIGTINGDIVSLKAKDTELGSTLTSIQTALEGKADKTTLEALENKVYTKTEVDALLEELNLTSVTQAIADNKTAIEGEVERAKSAENAILSTITTIVGEDKDKSIRTIAKEEVALVVDSAPETFDTLKEIAVWIENDETGAAAMANKIAAHSTILEGFGGEGQPAKVKDYVLSEIAAAKYDLPVATLETLGGIKSAAATVDNAVQVSAEGIATVGRVNVNTLVQTEGDFIILNGGKAQ